MPACSIQQFPPAIYFTYSNVYVSMLMAQFVLWQARELGWGWWWEEIQEGGDRCIPMSDSCWYIAETDTTL